MLRASPMSQVAKTRILWLMGLEQCIAGGICRWSAGRPRPAGRARRPLLYDLLFASFRPRGHRRRLRMVPHIPPQNPENDDLENVGSVVRDAFQVASHQ